MDLRVVDHLLNISISMMVALIFTKIENFVEKVLIFMPLTIAPSWLYFKVSNMVGVGGIFSWTRCILC